MVLHQQHVYRPILFERIASYEQQFNSTLLEVVVPDASVEFPTAGSNGDAWYSQLKREAGERNTAFFGKVSSRYPPSLLT
jgi:hypothetical protein